MLYRFFLTLCLTLSIATGVLAAYPYDSVAEIAVPKGQRFNGGSGTLIAVNESQALILTCQHVVLAEDKEVFIRWRDGQTSKGVVYSIAPNGLDAALVICPRPEGLLPVPVVALKPSEERTIVNAGYPGNDHVLRWQKGQTTKLTDTTLRYDVRPIPGMSGGATFDEHGNLVAVVQFYNRKGGGSTGGKALLDYIRNFIKQNTAYYGESPQHKTAIVECDPDGSLMDLPEEFSEWAAAIYIEFDTGPVKEFLNYLKDPDQFSKHLERYHSVRVPDVTERSILVPTLAPPVVIDTPRIHISVAPERTKITRQPRRIRKFNRRRFRSLRRR